MSILIEQDSDVALLHRGTRRFLIIGMLATALIVSAILLRQGLFRQTADLGFVTDSAQDISKGQSVKIAGFRVGSVKTVTLRADGKVEVRLEIDADYMRFVTRDAVIELRKEGLVGSAVLEVIPGPDRTKLAANDARLEFARADGLTAMALSLRDKVMPILGDVKAITGTLADPHHGLPATLAQVREVTASLNTLLQTGNTQVGDIGQAATATLGKAQQSLVQLDQTLDTVKTRLPALLDKTQRIVDHVEKVTADAETSVPPLLNDGRAAAADVREIVTGAKSATPFKNWVEPPPSTKLKADSDPRAEGVRAVR
jgi:phospholipid/cholesterol/gamma-HCH transport system substrate-binding protein